MKQLAAICLTFAFSSCVFRTSEEELEIKSRNESSQNQTMETSRAGFESNRLMGAVTCPMDGRPQNCYDGTCWSDRVSCNDPTFECGGFLHKCLGASDQANCCENSFSVCPWHFPYFCPEDGLCRAEEEGCPESGSCRFRGEPCSY